MKYDSKECRKRTYVWCDFETTGLFDILKDNIVYPIEVGIVFTDNDYNIYETYQDLILWDGLINEIVRLNPEKDNLHWPKEYQKAYEIHGIDVKRYFENGKNYRTVANNIYNLTNKYTFKNSYTNPVLISDNIQFEFRLMEFLMKDYCRKYSLNWPFHYCGYDTSEFLIRTDVGDPRNIEHSAIRDAAVLLKQMTMARDRINGF